MQTNDSRTILKLHNLRQTVARLRILDICMLHHEPLSVSQVAALAPSIHLATIYRTLELLSDKHLLTRIDFQEGKFRYEYTHYHHHHAVCESCGTIAEVQDTSLEKATMSVKLPPGFLLTKHAIELFGYCRNCLPKGHYAN